MTLLIKALLWWGLACSAAAFAVCGWDKRCARRGARRVPERTLFLLALLGGSAGALLGMKVWRHKTLHRSFRVGIPLILALQILVPAALYLMLRGG